jgi:hypothetical protein
MTDATLSWRGGKLLRHLTERLDSAHPFIDLNIHSLWALLAVRNALAYDDLSIGKELLARSQRILDEGGVSGQSRRELAEVLYGLRISGLPGKA